LRCLIGAKHRDELQRCRAKLTPDQTDKLDSAIAAAIADHLVASKPPEGGWQALVGASPWETDAAKLCGPIDPPMASRPSAGSRRPEDTGSRVRPGSRSPADIDLYDCAKAVEKQAFAAQNHSPAGKDLLAQRDADVARCFATVQNAPYAFTS